VSDDRYGPWLRENFVALSEPRSVSGNTAADEAKQSCAESARYRAGELYFLHFVNVLVFTQQQIDVHFARISIHRTNSVSYPSASVDSPIIFVKVSKKQPERDRDIGQE